MNERCGTLSKIAQIQDTHEMEIKDLNLWISRIHLLKNTSADFGEFLWQKRLAAELAAQIQDTHEMEIKDLNL